MKEKKRFWGIRGKILLVVLLVLLLPVPIIAVFSAINPPASIHIASEYFRLGTLKREWADLENVPEQLARSIVAAEDSGFCRHWGFDVESMKRSLADRVEGRSSTISQRVARDVFLWPREGNARRLLEVPVTLMIELFWSKSRVLEVYLNFAEFDEGVFGVAEASRRYFDKELGELSEAESAALSVVLPDPKARNASSLSPELERRVSSVLDGARTISRLGLDKCFLMSLDQ